MSEQHEAVTLIMEHRSRKKLLESVDSYYPASRGVPAGSGGGGTARARLHGAFLQTNTSALRTAPMPGGVVDCATAAS